MPRIIPTAEPFFFPGGKTACILIHGFTGTPKEMRPLGEVLAAQGYTVLGPRLAGHATRVEELTRMRWEDWLADLESAHDLLKGSAERVILMGLSMGGMLALTYAAHTPVDGLVVMSTPEHLPADPRVPYLVPLSSFSPYIPKERPYWCDQAAYAGHVSYAAEPMRSMAEVRDLLAEMHAGLAQVSAPALLIYSRLDPSTRAAEGHAEKILAKIGSSQKEIRWLERSGHVISEDGEREMVFRWTVDFVRQISGEPK